eukprot:8818393-Heterocapsa_arctica.AAC.1
MRVFSSGPRWLSLMRRSALDMIRLAAANTLGTPLVLGWSNASAIVMSQPLLASSGRSARIAANWFLHVSRILPRVAGEW